MKRRCRLLGHRAIFLCIGCPMQCRRCGAVAQFDGIRWRFG